MTLCEIHPIGEDVYYTNVPTSYVGLSYCEDALDILSRHEQGVTVVPSDSSHTISYLFPTLDNSLWLAYYQDNIKESSYLRMYLLRGTSRFSPTMRTPETDATFKRLFELTPSL